MDKLTVLKAHWEKSKLSPVFYHTTFMENVLSILKDQKIVANKGKSICKTNNGIVSLSDRINKGIVEFFGNVVFEFDAIMLFNKNRSIIPKIYGSLTNINKLYDERPLFENEWSVPNKLKFNIKDISKILLITSIGFREPSFKGLANTLFRKNIPFSFLHERWLSDKMVTDMTSYLLRIRGWRRFMKY